MKEDRLRSPRDKRQPRSEKRSEELTHRLKRVQESSRELCGRFPFTAKTGFTVHFRVFFRSFFCSFFGCFFDRFWVVLGCQNGAFLETKIDQNATYEFLIFIDFLLVFPLLLHLGGVLCWFYIGSVFASFFASIFDRFGGRFGGHFGRLWGVQIDQFWHYLLMIFAYRSKSGLRAPKRGPRAAKSGLRAPKSGQEPPKSAPRAAKRAPRAAKSGPRVA